MDLFADRSAGFPLAADVVVPVPTRRSRLVRRGFDQAAELARAIANQRGLPVLRALHRVDAAGSQTVLGRVERATNVRGAFRVVRRDAVAGRTVLLVDDVLTSGATLGECTHALRRAGVIRVEAWTLGRSVR